MEITYVTAIAWTAADTSKQQRVDPAKPLSTPSGLVDGADAQALAKAGAVVVDVRTKVEYLTGHVPGAVNIPHDEMEKRAGELGGKDTPIVLYCRSGKRSAVAAEALQKIGYQRVWDFQRYDAWPGK